MIIIDDMRSGYIEIVKNVLEYGTKSSPRGQDTREIIGAQIMLLNPVDSLPLGINRKLNTDLACVEALQLIGGVSLPDLMVRVAPNTERFLTSGTNDHRYFHGAYGPRIASSLNRVVELLKRDQDSRQAVVNIWHWGDDLLSGEPDVPCTLTLQFMLRDGELRLITTMRSNDVWWGVAYDFFQFTQLQLTVAAALGVDAGPYIHQAGSLHIYDRDMEAIERLDVPDPRVTPALPRGVGPVHAAISQRCQEARTLLTHPDRACDDPDMSWYRGRMRRVLGC